MPWPRRRSRTAEEVGRLAGFRSGLEEQIAAQLEEEGVAVDYESLTIPFLVEESRTYTPDWPLPNGIVVESKGRFVTADRKKHLLIKRQYPDLDLRFVFSTSRTKIGKGSKTSYGDWCRHKGFQYADTFIPVAWLREPPNEKSLAVIKRLMENTE